MTIAFITHPDCLLHEMGKGHPEQPARLQVIEEAVKNSSLIDQLNYYIAPLADHQQLERAHDRRYLDMIFATSPNSGLVPLDPDTWMNPYTLTAALYAAGAAVLGVDLVVSGAEKSAFCNIRPPGHHAEYNKAMGFCFFNNVVVAARHALDHYHLKRVAIIDFDVHHGNGTEQIIKQDDRILYCSSFQHPFYPFCGDDTINPHIINIPLTAGTTGNAFREAVAHHWFQSITSFAPEMIFISAGFDAYQDDDMSDLLLTADDYGWITYHLKQIANTVCNGKIVSVLEGGYALTGLGACVVAHLLALADN